MEPNEIIAGNRLIAEFMGIKPNKIKESEAGIYTSEYAGTGGPNITILNYRNDWAFLMPAVEKIAAYRYDDEYNDYAYPRTFGMKSEDGQFMVRINRQILFLSPTLIEAAYLAIIDFITWYNQNK